MLAESANISGSTLSGYTMASAKQLPAEAHRPPPRSRFTALFAFLLAFGALLAVSRAPPSQDYALCSLGRKIYTVDIAHPNVECIVVSNTTIADVGDLGGYHRSASSAL